MMKKYDVLLVIDDLKKHADIYREISLTSNKTPGRDAYPSDIFYAHSRLLEKGTQHINGGSITILPIIETKNGDITDYISTNIISICDGQLVLSAKNFAKGEKPAVDYGLSVSRLGGNVQSEEMKKIGSKLRRELLSYLEVRDVYELANMDEMSSELQQKMKSGHTMIDKLKQYKFTPKSKEEMINDFNFLFSEEQK
jgi:F-type H+-transporting ATPase subunit alpha